MNDTEYRASKRMVVYTDKILKKKVTDSAKKHGVSISREVMEILHYYFKMEH